MFQAVLYFFIKLFDWQVYYSRQVHKKMKNKKISFIHNHGVYNVHLHARIPMCKYLHLQLLAVPYKCISNVRYLNFFKYHIIIKY